MTDFDQTLTTHALVRTSPKGDPLVGRCVLCGAENLRSSAVEEPCPNPGKKSGGDALVQLINGDVH